MKKIISFLLAIVLTVGINGTTSMAMNSAHQRAVNNLLNAGMDDRRNK